MIISSNINLLDDLENELWNSKDVIYCYTNKINGKRYIGKTNKSLKNRHKGHMKAVKYSGNVSHKQYIHKVRSSFTLWTYYITSVCHLYIIFGIFLYHCKKSHCVYSGYFSIIRLMSCSDPRKPPSCPRSSRERFRHCSRVFPTK